MFAFTVDVKGNPITLVNVIWGGSEMTARRIAGATTIRLVQMAKVFARSAWIGPWGSFARSANQGVTETRPPSKVSAAVKLHM
jgi:hypothetical protein